MECSSHSSCGLLSSGSLSMQSKTIDIIEFVLQNEVDYIVAAIRDKDGLNMDKVISDLKYSRTQYGLKVQSIVEELIKLNGNN
jgi:hypothetical protein